MFPPIWLHKHVVGVLHIAADSCQRYVLTARGAATAKCSQLACVTFNYGSSTFHRQSLSRGHSLCLKPQELCSSHGVPWKLHLRWFPPVEASLWDLVGVSQRWGKLWLSRVLQALFGQSDNTPPTHPTKQPDLHHPHQLDVKWISPALIIQEVRVHGVQLGWSERVSALIFLSLPLKVKYTLDLFIQPFLAISRTLRTCNAANDGLLF